MYSRLLVALFGLALPIKGVTEGLRQRLQATLWLVWN